MYGIEVYICFLVNRTEHQDTRGERHGAISLKLKPTLSLFSALKLKSLHFSDCGS
jgi:hypothetical protein